MVDSVLDKIGWKWVWNDDENKVRTDSNSCEGMKKLIFQINFFSIIFTG